MSPGHANICQPGLTLHLGLDSIGSVYAAILVLSKQCKVYVVARSNYDVLKNQVSPLLPIFTIDRPESWLMKGARGITWNRG